MEYENHLTKRAEPEGNDFYRDGLLVCGQCKKNKEMKINFPMLDGSHRSVEKIVPVVCECRAEELKKRKKEFEYKSQMMNIEKMRSASLIESKFKSARLSEFQQTENNEKLYKAAKKYVENFSEMYRENQGILFWGTVGTGKSYTAACIANELLEQMNPVIMTSFVKILQNMQNFGKDEEEYLAKLNSPKLLIIDDLGTERNTDYALEKVYNVIDSRYRAKKPLILTTNLTLKEMQEESDIRYRRIYDRIFEMCYPFHVTGKSWREQEAAKRYDRMQKLMEE